VQQAIAAFLEQRPDIALVDLDCSEFPCIATLSPQSSGDGDPMSVVHTLPKEWGGAVFDENAAILASVTATEGEDGERAQLISLAAAPESMGDGGVDWSTRTQARTQSIAEGFLEDVEHGGGADEDDVDIQ
jgi:hypothetical protein